MSYPPSQHFEVDAEPQFRDATQVQPQLTVHHVEPFPLSARVSLTGIFLILLVGALYYARAFFLPIVLALLLTFTVEPLVRGLARRGIPSVITAAVLMVAVGAFLATAAALLSGPFTQMIVATPQVVQKLHERFTFVENAVTRLGAVGHELQKLGESSGGESPRVVVAQPGLLASAAGTLADIGITLGAALILTLFLLAWGDALRTKLIHVLPNLSDKKRSLRLLMDIEGEVSRYLLTIVAINAGVGLLVGVSMFLYGMPNPLLWAVAAFLLNFIPFVGTLTGQLVMFAVAIGTFPTLFQAALPPLTYLLIGIVEGSFVTPSVLGRRLELNPVAILIVLALTTWMWGLVGTVIGVPILVVIKVFSAHFPSLSHLAEFISAEAPPSEDAVTSGAPIIAKGGKRDTEANEDAVGSGPTSAIAAAVRAQ